MATLLQQINNLEKLNESVILKKIFEALKLAEKEVLELNKKQLSKGKNADGNEVGTYAESTQGYADLDGISISKTAGSPYNFEWTGEFYKGFTLSISGDEAVISSTGIGGGSKKEFLTTNNLLGLSIEDREIIIRKEILPFIHKFSRETLNI